MKKFILLFLIFAVVGWGTTFTGTLPSPLTGNATGTLTLALTQPATVSPTCAASLPNGGLYRITASNGSLNVTSVVGNDCLVPATTSYTAIFVDSAGNTFSGIWKITGATFNLSNQIFGVVGAINVTQSGNAYIQMPAGTSLYLNNVTCGTGCSGGGGAPTGPAGGDLTGDYPNPGVGQLNGAAVPASADLLSTNSSHQVVAATHTNVFNLFTGCSGIQYPGFDGTCHSASGTTANQNIRTIGFHFDGAGSALSGTLTGCRYIPYAGTITGWAISTDAAGSGTIGVRSATTTAYASGGVAGYGGYTDVVNGGTAPTISATAFNSSTTLTSWVTAVTAGQMYCFQLTSPATAKTLDAVLTVAAN